MRRRDRRLRTLFLRDDSYPGGLSTVHVCLGDHELKTVSSAPEALAAVVAKPGFDLAVLDHGDGSRSFVGLCRDLRKAQAAPLEIILLDRQADLAAERGGERRDVAEQGIASEPDGSAEVMVVKADVDDVIDLPASTRSVSMRLALAERRIRSRLSEMSTESDGFRERGSRSVRPGRDQVDDPEGLPEAPEADGGQRRDPVDLEHYRCLVEGIEDVIFSTDAHGLITYISPVAESIAGYTNEDLVGRSVFELIHPDDFVEARDKLENLLSGARSVADLRFRVKSGEYLTARVSARPIVKDGKIVGTRGVLSDVTERRAAEQELKESQSLLASIFNGIQDGLCLLDREYRILAANPTMEEWFPHAKPLVGRICYEVIHHRSEPCRCPCTKAMQSGQPSSKIIARSGPDGEKTGWVEIHAFPLRDEGSGEIIGVIEHSRDVTHQVEAEDRLQRVLRLESLGRFTGGIAHDFRNLMMVIHSASQCLRQRLDGDDALARFARRELDAIDRTCQSAVTLTQGLLGFVRSDGPRRERLDIDEVVDATIELLERLLPAGIEILRLRGRGTRVARGDRGQLEQILINLCGNARDAMPDGGRVTIETTSCTLDEEFARKNPWARPGQWVRVSVHDTGVGMDETTLNQIFDPLFTTKQSESGTGLGMASVHESVKQHGGLIDVVASPGAGTSCHVYLPLIEAGSTETLSGRERQIDARDPRAMTRQLRREDDLRGTVLVVDDLDSLRTTMVRYLESLGYRVRSAVDGIEALEIVQSEPSGVDLVITDLAMPRLGGRELHETISAQWPEVRFLFCSGDKTAIEALARAGLSWIEKPFELDHLADLVSSLLAADADSPADQAPGPTRGEHRAVPEGRCSAQ